MVTGHTIEKKLSLTSMFKKLFISGDDNLNSPDKILDAQSRNAMDQSRGSCEPRMNNWVCVYSSTSSSEAVKATEPIPIAGPSTHRAHGMQTRARNMIRSSMDSSRILEKDVQEWVPRKGFSNWRTRSCLNQSDGTGFDVDDAVLVSTQSQDSLVLVSIGDDSRLSPAENVPPNSPANSHTFGLTSLPLQAGRGITNPISKYGATGPYLSLDADRSTQLTTDLSEAIDFVSQFSNVISRESYSPDEPSMNMLLDEEEAGWRERRYLSQDNLGDSQTSSCCSSNCIPSGLLYEPSEEPSEPSSTVLDSWQDSWEESHISLLRLSEPSLRRATAPATTSTEASPLIDSTYFSKELSSQEATSTSPKFETSNAEGSRASPKVPQIRIEPAEDQMPKSHLIMYSQRTNPCKPANERWSNHSRSIFGSTPPAYITSGGVHLRGGGRGEE